MTTPLGDNYFHSIDYSQLDIDLDESEFDIDQHELFLPLEPLKSSLELLDSPSSQLLRFDSFDDDSVVMDSLLASQQASGGDPPRRPDGNQPPRGHYLDGPPSLVPDKPIFADPAIRSELDPLTRDLALRQTAAARGLLYAPGDHLRNELGLAAVELYGLAESLGVHDGMQQALGARLLGSEGILAHQGPDALLGALRRVAQDLPPGPSVASAQDRAVVLALMGDIGALYANTGATTGVEGRSPDQAEALRLLLSDQMARQGLTPPDTGSTQLVQAFGGSSAVGPAKKDERIRPENDRPPRSGIHNLGQEVDQMLGIPANERLPATRWDVAQLRGERVLQSAEPLVGHMSGSPAEILQVWDMLRGDPPYTGVLLHQLFVPSNDPMGHLSQAAQDAHYARAAGASAFLVGMGYHSAVEVLEGTLTYSGQSVRVAIDGQQDAAHLFGHGAATDLMNELMASQMQQ
ncbi:hypothetical protein [Chitinimonas lacunae]|uniref:Uncharacterized protein n=1 Tax=Chitinimonas lacunae TaxID=1963018 RepID=A0ABV8MMB2_9NEIS